MQTALCWSSSWQQHAFTRISGALIKRSCFQQCHPSAELLSLLTGVGTGVQPEQMGSTAGPSVQSVAVPSAIPA